MGGNRLRVSIVSFGMEHCRRGVEAHARMLFEKLKEEESIDVTLIKGSGAICADEVVLSVPKRHTWLNRLLGKIRGYNVYWEQVFFIIRLSFYLFRKAKAIDVIYTQEYVHLIGISTLKKRFNWPFRIIYCEGFVSSSDTRTRYADVLQEVNKNNYTVLKPLAEKKGVPIRLVPHFFDPIWEDSSENDDLIALIEKFKGSNKLLLYVGPTELEEKNFIRLEEAVKGLDDSWKMLICGDVPTHRMESLNTEGKDRVMAVYVSHATMQRIYPMADFFVLPSLNEAFGIATIEAMGHGVPVLLHESLHSKWLCNDDAQCINMHETGGVERYLNQIQDVEAHKASKGLQNQKYFLETFTWEKVRTDYLKLLEL